ncbi:hypothetical protein L6R52_00675 [Myxococcota bacterium]|nr:hypothetical protein [Myxococcota bacterium]
MGLRSAIALIVALALSACGGTRDRSSGGTIRSRDAGTTVSDAGPGDGALADASDDGGAQEDAALADAGLDDAALPDAALADAASAPDASLPPPPSGAFLYVGAGGGGPATDLYVDDVAAVLSAVGPNDVGETVPTDLADRFGLLAIMNPTEPVPSAVGDAAAALLARGGRVLIVMEHCKNGCWGDAAGDNALLARLGSDMTLSGTGGAPLSRTSLVITPVAGLTTGVASIVVYYSGSVDVGSGVALGRIAGGDTVVGYQRAGGGEIIVVADSSMFGYVLDEGDNRRFLTNLATFAP